MVNKVIIGMGAVGVAVVLALSGCSGERVKNRAKEAAAKYWQDKAYPGKSFDVQVIEAEKADNGLYRVKGIVDGETRVGLFNPDTENFSEGYYSLAHERSKRIAELEQESKYWKEKAEALEREIYKLKVRLNIAQGKSPDATELEAKSDEKGNAGAGAGSTSAVSPPPAVSSEKKPGATP